MPKLCQGKSIWEFQTLGGKEKISGGRPSDLSNSLTILIGFGVKSLKSLKSLKLSVLDATFAAGQAQCRLLRDTHVENQSAAPRAAGMSCLKLILWNLTLCHGRKLDYMPIIENDIATIYINILKSHLGSWVFKPCLVADMMPELSSDPSLIPARRRTTLWERQARRQGRSRCPRASSRPDDLDRCHRCYRYIDTSICSVQLFDDSCDLRFRWRRGSQCTTMTSVRSAPDSFASFSRHQRNPCVAVVQLDRSEVYWSGEDGKTYVYDAVMEKYSLLQSQHCQTE